MSEADTLRHEVARSHEAERLLADPLLTAAFETVDASLRAAWLATADAQERERERLWMMVKLLARVKAQLTEAVDTGKLAAAVIEEKAGG